MLPAKKRPSTQTKTSPKKSKRDPFSEVFGVDRGFNLFPIQQDRLLKQLVDDSLHHALLFCGAEGDLRFELSIRLAKATMCQKISNRSANDGGLLKLSETCCPSPSSALSGENTECDSCRMVRVGSHPDLLIIDGAEKKSDSSSENLAQRARDLLHNLSLRPFTDGGKRVVIVHNVDHLSAQIANTLLKSVEEPSPGNYFLLSANSRARVLLTLQSRSQVIPLPSLTPDEVIRFLREREGLAEYSLLSDEELLGVFDLAHGQTTRFLEYLPRLKEIADKRARLDGLLSALMAGTLSNALETIREMFSDREDAPLIFEMLKSIAEGKMKNGAEEEGDLARMQTNRWALLLSDLLVAERLWAERNLQINYLMPALLLHYLRPSSAPFFGEGREPLNALS